LIKYSNKLYGLENLIKKIEDERKRPRITTQTIVKSALVMCLTRMGSLNALEQMEGNRFWKGWIEDKLPSADTIGRVFAQIDEGAIRDGIYQIYSRLRRNKAMKPFAEGLFGLVIDGHESTASYKRCCEGCMKRRIKTEKGEIIQYYHRQVTAILLCKDLEILLDSEQQRAGEDEVEAAIRLIKRVLKKYPRAFEVVIADGLYVRANFFKLVIEAGKEIIAVLKDERRDLVQDARSLFEVEKSEITEEGQTRRECWDIEHFNSWEQLGKEVRVVRLLETTVTKSQLTGKEEEKISDWIWVTTITKNRACTKTVVNFGHGRWRIENNGFNELVNDWKADHLYKHDPTAIGTFYLLTMLAYNLFYAFIGRNIKAVLRNKYTKKHWGNVIAAELYCNIPKFAYG
jgi:hypothetical protein